MERDYETLPLVRPGYVARSSKAGLLPLNDPLERRAKALGWFSLGLGAAMTFAPRLVARAIGLRPSVLAHTTIRAIGVRELAVGFGILAKKKPAGLLWTRVAGDVVDLTLLRRGASNGGTARALVAGASVLGITAVDVASAVQLTRHNMQERKEMGGMRVCRAITINRPPDEVYRFWRHLENLPQFMSHLERVETYGSEKSRWVAKAPLGTTVEWYADILFDRPNELIAWHSTGDSQVQNEGWVRFESARGGRETVVRAELHYQPPGGALGATLAKLFGEDPAHTVATDLRRLKQVLETGEVTHSDASIHKLPHPAQPPKSFDPSTKEAS
jgi:uncharacterized membrane protein